MVFTFACPKCGSRLEADSALSGGFADCPGCHASVHVPPPRVVPGTTIGGFRLERLLGRGGMGEVYLATQLSMDRQVAVKILPAGLTEKQAFVDRFLLEVRAAAKLEHPNIVTAFDAGEDAGTYYLAMAYVEGEGLDQALKRDGPLAEAQVLPVALKLARALNYAWEQFGILHRDIKPANIMLDRFGEPKLMDLGVAKIVGEETGLTLTGMALGTPNYMSPEQARGASDVDCRSDIYSLGCCMYHLLTGHPPYVGSNPLEVMNLHLTAPIPQVRQERPAVSAATAALITATMQKDRAARPASWPVFAGQLEAVLAGQPVPALRRPQRRALWVTLAAAGLLIALVAGLAIGRSLRRPRRGDAVAHSGAKQAAEGKARSNAPPAQSGSGVNQAMDRVADLLLARELKQAREFWEQERSRLAGSLEASRLQELDAAVNSAIHIPDRIIATFRDDVGKTITVALRDGPLTLTVSEVKEYEVLGMTQRGDKAAPATFAIRELDLDEQLRRLALHPDAYGELTRGIVFLNYARVALATASLRRAEHPLADALIVALERRRLEAAETVLPRRPLRDAMARSRPAQAPAKPAR